MGLQRLRCRSRRLGSVEIIDQPVGRDDLTGMEEQVCEQGALARATELDCSTAVLDLQLAQDSVFHSLCHNRL
jgi:hypothetical protein